MTDKTKCGAIDPKTSRVCIYEPAHKGMHFAGTGFHWPDGAKAPAAKAEPKKKAAKKPPAKTAPKPKVTGRCNETMAGVACQLPKGHPGDHAGDGSAWRRDRTSGTFDCGAEPSPLNPRPRAQCYCGGKNGRSKSHGLGEPGCNIPRNQMCECDGHDAVTHMIGAPGCEFTAKAAPVKIESEPGDPEVDEAARLAAIDEDSEDEIADEPDSSARWYCEARFIGVDGREHKCEHRNEHNGPHYAWSAVAGKMVHAKPSDEDAGDDNDPFEDEVRSDEDRAFARQQREAREAHAAELEAEEPTPAPTGPLTKIGNYEVHPAAALFPMIDEAEYPAFRDDIRDNGQRKRIVRIGKLILDGRNRLRACLEIGVEPKFRDFGEEPSDGSDPIAFVISENVRRRHLNETQRAFVGAELVPMYEEQAKERQRGALKQNAATVSPNSGSRDKGKATEMAARAVNVGKTSVEAALKVKREAAPEVLAASKDAGKLSVSAAADLAKLPKQKQREIIEKVDSKSIKAGKVRSLVRQEGKREVVRRINSGLVAPMPAGQFGLIYADYPWPYENSDQHNGSRGHMGYPPMAMVEILAHAREAAKRAAKDCIIALWVTNLHIPNIGRVVEAYGAEHHTMLTWPKPRAGVGTWPRGQTEHVVIASIGAPVHTLNEISTLLPSWQPAHPGEHSSKPAELGPLLAQHCGGPFLELFARDQREGWTCWGAEVDKFATTEAA